MYYVYVFVCLVYYVMFGKFLYVYVLVYLFRWILWFMWIMNIGKKVYEGLKFVIRFILKYGIFMYFFEDYCLLIL